MSQTNSTTAILLSPNDYFVTVTVRADILEQVKNGLFHIDVML